MCGLMLYIKLSKLLQISMVLSCGVWISCLIVLFIIEYNIGLFSIFLLGYKYVLIIIVVLLNPI